MRARFLAVFLTVLTLLSGYLGWRVALPFRDDPVIFFVLGWLFIVGYLSLLWMPLFFWSSDDSAPRAWERIAERIAHLTMGFLSILLLVTVIRDLAALVFFVSGSTAFPDSRVSAIVMLGFAGMMFFVGLLLAFAGPRIVRVEHRIGSKDDTPLRLVQVSDLHVGTWIGTRYVERLVTQIERSGPIDFIMLTGDIGDGDVRVHGRSLDPFHRLKPRLGKFSVTGNHEGYWDAAGWNRKLEELGFRVLHNDGQLVTDGNRRLTVHGIDDASPDVETALGNRLPGVPSLLLAHQPHHAADAILNGVSLVLSGHTHAGQFLPWSLLIGFFHDFAHGLYRVEKTAIYVNAGTGFWGPPLRLGTRSEVTVLTI